MARFLLGALLAATVTLASLAPPGDASEARVTVALLVVAHPGVPVPSLDRDELRRIFLMRRRFWPDGKPVLPVNLPATSSARIAFSRTVLGRTPRALTEYFNDLYFHGTRPPPVLDSEAAVLLYVARTRGAVGYVTAGALGSEDALGVKVLLTLDAP